MGDTLTTRKKQNLEKHLANLHEEYDAAFRQLDQVLSQVDKEKIERQIKALEEEIKRKENDLKSLETAGGDFLPKPPDGDLVSRGLAAVADLPDPAVRIALAELRPVCEAACEQFEVVRDYKNVHDLLHELQFRCYIPLNQEVGRFPDDDLAMENVMDHELTLGRIIDDLEEVAERRSLDTSWLQSLMEARDKLVEAIQHKDLEPLKRAIWLIRRVLTVQPDRVNTLLKEAARATRLPALVEAWTRVHDDLAAQNLDPQKLGEFREGLETLDALSHNLSNLVTDHDRWQNLDVELRRIDDTIRQDVVELEMSWSDLRTQAAALCSNNNSEWATSFRRAGVELDRAIAKGDTVQIRRFFRSYHRRSGMRFHQVDTHLMKLCGDLGKIGTQLTAKMGMI